MCIRDRGKIAGFNIYESNNLSANTEIIAGHPDWCTRVNEWQVAVHLQDLSGSGKYIGASAVQGRKIYAHKVTKSKAVQIKMCIRDRSGGETSWQKVNMNIGSHKRA